MDNPVDSITSPPGGAEQQMRPKKRRGCFFYGCLTVNLAILVAICGLFLLFRFGRTTVTPTVEEFLAASEGGDYDHAYAMLGDEWAQNTSREEFPEFFKIIHNTLGPRRSLSMRGINLQTIPTGTFARVNYAAVYDKGEVELVFTLKKDGAQWQILGLRYNSPLVMTAFRCAKCGADNSPDAKFCAKCGAPLRQQQDPVERFDGPK